MSKVDYPAIATYVTAVATVATAAATGWLAWTAWRSLRLANLEFFRRSQSRFVLGLSGSLEETNGQQSIAMHAWVEETTGTPSVLHRVQYWVDDFGGGMSDEWVDLMEREVEFHPGRRVHRDLRLVIPSVPEQKHATLAVLYVVYRASMRNKPELYEDWRAQYRIERGVGGRVDVVSDSEPQCVSRASMMDEEWIAQLWFKLKAWPCRIRRKLGGGCPK